MKRLLLIAGLAIGLIASVYAAEQVFSDHRPVAGETVQLTLQKLLALYSAKYSHITTNTTTTAKSGAGVLVGIVINTKGATANTATIYDNTAGSGTVIAVIDTTSAVQAIRYGVAFNTGLTIVTAAGTAADLTVSYR